jgi:hypothetical protein
MTDQATILEREIAYKAYINEITPNGNSRITNATICAGPDGKIQRHIATQMDMAFQAGWNARATIAELKGEQP